MSRGGETGAAPLRGPAPIAPQAPSDADVSAISGATSTVAAALASFNETDCYSTEASVNCYPSSYSLPPPESWAAWEAWASTMISYAQLAYSAAQNAQAAAARIASVNAAAYESAQSAGSSVGAVAVLIAGAQQMNTPQGWTWESADGSKGQMPAAASWSYNKEQEEYTFHPNATFTSTLSRALSYCQGACAYATEAVKQAQAAMPTPAPSEVARTSFSSMSRDMRSGAGAPVASVPSACEAWTLGVTVNVGQTMFSLADQQKVALSALQLAAGGRIGEPVTYLIDGAWYHFQPQGKQVSVYYCSRSPVQVSRPEGPRPLTRPVEVGSSGVGQGPGEQTPASTPNASPAPTQPPATTGASNAATTGVVTGSLVATAVVFTLVAWTLEKGLDKVFSSKVKK